MKFRHLFFPLLFLVLLCSCDKEGIDMDDVEVPNNYALSAGTSTIFLNSSVAYDTEADWVSDKYSTRYNY